LYEIIG
jgi:serine/threonine protein kinase